MLSDRGGGLRLVLRKTRTSLSEKQKCLKRLYVLNYWTHDHVRVEFSTVEDEYTYASENLGETIENDDRSGGGRRPVVVKDDLNVKEPKADEKEYRDTQTYGPIVTIFSDFSTSCFRS
nr:hypothetical protein HmN_001009800 [Hymenolepis microstoma]